MNMRARLRPLKIRVVEALRVTRRVDKLPGFLFDKFKSKDRDQRVVYLVEDANWSIRWDGINITRRLAIKGLTASIDSHPSFYTNSILHFGSANIFYSFGKSAIGSSNKIAVTFFHGQYGDTPELDARLDFVLGYIKDIDALIVSNKTMQNRFLEWGVPEDKVTLIHIGVDTTHFKPATADDYRTKRVELGIDDDTFLIGSFQKDGTGWGDGLEPKLIKGPDLFVEAVTLLSQKRKVACLLAGPARGYVKRGLERAGIGYKHFYFDNPDDVAELFTPLDAYLVSSREEGGPKAILEAMASGTPLVTTRVGMAPDVVQHGENGLLVDVEDVVGMADMLLSLASDASLSDRLRAGGRANVRAYDWEYIARSHGLLYRSLME